MESFIDSVISGSDANKGDPLAVEVTKRASNWGVSITPVAETLEPQDDTVAQDNAVDANEDNEETETRLQAIDKSMQPFMKPLPSGKFDCVIPSCKISPSGITGFRAHYLRKHAEDKFKIYVCDHCPGKYGTLSCLKDHLRIAHGVDARGRDMLPNKKRDRSERNVKLLEVVESLVGDKGEDGSIACKSPGCFATCAGNYSFRLAIEVFFPCLNKE